MPYRAELNYLMKVLDKLHIQALRIRADSLPGQYLDMGLRKLLGLEADFARMFQPPDRWVEESTIYKVTDPFQCSYITLLLPDAPEADVLLVGPYLTAKKTREQLMEEAERYGLPMGRFPRLEECYSYIPVIQAEAVLLAGIHVLGETLWGEGAAFSIIHIDQTEPAGSADLLPREEVSDPKEVMLHIKAMETRYAYENQLMELVSKGLVHRAELMLSGVSEQFMEQRMTDPVRNLKNYCVVGNTILRKAAEWGGVHPVYLDSVSSAFAREIESLNSMSAGQDMFLKMIRSYSRLVKTHSSKQYSSPVQKAVTIIDSDLSGDLSLKALAAMQGVNASYLSTLFKRETGRTVTDYVNQKRVDLAIHLLATTKLQVQTIAQHCGISDVNYFSKVFKKYTRKTPKEYRGDVSSF